MSKKNKTLVLVLLLAVVLLAAVPFLTLKDAEFGGSDDAGSVMVEEIHGEYEPWFTPVLEDFLGKKSCDDKRQADDSPRNAKCCLKVSLHNVHSI